MRLAHFTPHTRHGETEDQMNPMTLGDSAYKL